MHTHPAYTMQPSHQLARTHLHSITPSLCRCVFIFFFSLTNYYMSSAHSLAPAIIPTAHIHLDTIANGDYTNHHHTLGDAKCHHPLP